MAAGVPGVSERRRVHAALPRVRGRRRDAGRRRQRDRRRVRGELRARGGHALHVRIRRRPACRWCGTAICTRTAASGARPPAATAEFVRAQSGEAEMPTFGPHPVTVPGAVEAWFTLIEKFATRSFGELVQRALHYAEEGFPLTKRGAWFFQNSAIMYEHFGLPDFHDYYGDVDAGDWLRQPELARTIRTLAADGPDAYYRGPIGEAIAERLQRAGGCMTAADVAAHTGAWVDPLRAPLPRRGDPRDAAADAGPHRARGAADRRRPRPRRRRPRPSASVDRGDQARAGRPAPLSGRSRRDDRLARSAVARRLGRGPPGRDRPAAAPAPPPRTSSPTAAPSTCARPTATG